MQKWNTLEHQLPWDSKEVTAKALVRKNAKKSERRVDFASLMGSCHRTSTELAKHLEKCEGRVKMRGDNVKDDDGNQQSSKKGRISFASGSSQFHNTSVPTSQQCRASKKKKGIDERNTPTSQHVRKKMSSGTDSSSTK